MAHDMFTVRARAVIFHEGKLFVVRHRPDATFWALPGGHMDHGEGVLECFEREIIEELGIKPKIDKLLYVHTFINPNNDTHTVEFIFQVENAADYLDFDKKERSHDFELFETKWTGAEDNLNLLPHRVAEDLKKGTFGTQPTIFLNDFSNAAV